MPLTLTCGDSFVIAGMVFVMEMRRLSRFLTKVMEMSWMLSWESMPCNSWTWDLSPDPRPITDVVRETQLRSGALIDATGSKVPADVPAIWKQFRI